MRIRGSGHGELGLNPSLPTSPSLYAQPPRQGPLASKRLFRGIAHVSGGEVPHSRLVADVVGRGPEVHQQEDLGVNCLAIYETLRYPQFPLRRLQ